MMIAIHECMSVYVCAVAGNETVDNVCIVLLSTSMFVGGILGFVLDNVIPGMHSVVSFLQTRWLHSQTGDMRAAHDNHIVQRTHLHY